MLQSWGFISFLSIMNSLPQVKMHSCLQITVSDMDKQIIFWNICILKNFFWSQLSRNEFYWPLVTIQSGKKGFFCTLKSLMKVITFYHFRFSTSCWVWPALLHLRSSSHTCGVRCWFPHLGFWNLSQMSLAKTSNL